MKTILLMISSLAICCAQELTVGDLANKYESYSITDGSSVHVFHKDGKYIMHSLGISGRKIVGTWKMTEDDRRLYRIDGNWKWSNGEVPIVDDKRIMIMDIRVTDTIRTDVVTVSNEKIFGAYFLIEELVKIKSP